MSLNLLLANDSEEVLLIFFENKVNCCLFDLIPYIYASNPRIHHFSYLSTSQGAENCAGNRRGGLLVIVVVISVIDADEGSICELDD